MPPWTVHWEHTSRSINYYFTGVTVTSHLMVNLDGEFLMNFILFVSTLHVCVRIKGVVGIIGNGTCFIYIHCIYSGTMPKHQAWTSQRLLWGIKIQSKWNTEFLTSQMYARVQNTMCQYVTRLCIQVLDMQTTIHLANYIKVTASTCSLTYM